MNKLIKKKKDINLINEWLNKQVNIISNSDNLDSCNSNSSKLFEKCLKDHSSNGNIYLKEHKKLL